MATIAEIREKYPQYSDMSDTALADALHAKFYSDLPKPDFYSKIGLTQAEAPRYASAVPQVTPEGQLIRQDAIPAPRAEPGFGDRVLGAIETPLAIGTGMLAGAVSPFAGVAGTIASGKYGTQEGVRTGEDVAKRVSQAMTYQPRSQTGQEAVGAIGETMQGLGLEALPFAQTATVAGFAPAATRQAAQIARTEGQLARQAISEIPAVKAAQEARVAESYARAPQIDAANLAQNYGIKLNPAVSNPSRLSRVEGMLVGDRDISAKFASENAPVFTNQAKKAVGLGETETLNDAAFTKLKNAPDITDPYTAVRNRSGFVADESTLAKLDDARSPQLVGDIEGKAAAKISKKIDAIKERLAEGIDGKTLLDSVQDFRAQASSIYNKGQPTKPLKAGDRQLAKLYDTAADALEDMIDSNLSGKALDDYRNARTKYAQINSLEAATNKVTGTVDPMKLAKQMENGRPLSGPLADLGTIAANFPDIATPGAGASWLQRGATTLTRAGVPGTIGFAIGNVPGAVIGAGIGELGSRLLASQMGRPGYQRARAIPRDYRPPINNLRPVEPGASNIVPFDPRNAPNFIMAENERLRMPIDPNRPDLRQPMPATEAAPVNALRLGMSSAEDTMASLRTETARQARMAKLAEAEALAAERAGRAPTSGEVLFDIDPVSGKFVPVDRGIRGATPETFQDFGASLKSAADKVGGGRSFALSAEELAAWNRTKVDIAEVAKGFEKLTDKQIAERMLDRKWVADTVKAAQEKAQAFEVIAQRSKDQQLMMQARANRERMLDVAESLQDVLARERPDVSRKSQGPKTRAAIRNNMRGAPPANNLLED